MEAQFMAKHVFKKYYLKFEIYFDFIYIYFQI